MKRSAVATWLRLTRVYNKVEHALLDHLRQWDLSLAQFDVIAQVGAAEGLTQQELADALLVTKGNVCQLLDRMERSRLLVRRQEGRANRIFLTPSGRALFDQVIPAHEAAVEEQLSGLTQHEQRELLVLLRKLDRSLS